MGILTEDDKTILPMALRVNGGFYAATRWYLRGWDPLWFQYEFHHYLQKNTTFLAGIASGKSTTIAASNIIDCLTTPYFRALNTSVTAKQSEIPFEMISGWLDGNYRIEHLIEDISLRPYPTIKFKNGSEYIFRTAGRDGRFIRGLEFDRINYDEAGLDALGETIKILRGRLRGVRPDGTQRMARLDVTTSPTDAIWLKERFYKGWAGSRSFDPVAYKSIRATTFMNTRLDPEQIRMMTLEYTDEMASVELMAEFPDYGMSFFPSSHITACTDQDLNDEMEEAIHPENNRLVKKGYNMLEDSRHGILKFEVPQIPGHYYIMAGDPGTDDPPRRNSAVVMCFDITNRPMRLVYFDWVQGHGSYNPFLQSFKYCMAKYGPVYSGMDTTGTQKAIDELAFANYGITIDGINFNRDKEGMLNSLSLAITSHQFKWPVIKGLNRQLSSYTRDSDKDIPQDIVMTLAQVSYLARYEGASPSEVTSIVRPFKKTRSRTGRWRRR